MKSEPPKKRTRSKSVGVEDKVLDRGGLTASVVVAPTNDPTQPLSVVQVSDFIFISSKYLYLNIIKLIH